MKMNKSSRFTILLLYVSLQLRVLTRNILVTDVVRSECLKHWMRCEHDLIRRHMTSCGTPWEIEGTSIREYVVGWYVDLHDVGTHMAQG